MAQPVSSNAAKDPAALETANPVGAVVTTVGLTLALNTWLVASSPHELLSTRHILGSLMLWLSVVPTIWYVIERRLRFPLIPVLAAIHFVGYGIPVFRDEFIVQLTPLEDADVMEGCEVALAGIATLVAGMLFAFRRRTGRAAVSWPSDDRTVAWRFAVASVVGLALRFLLERELVPDSMGQPVSLLSALAEIGACVVMVLWFRGRASGASAVVAAATVAGLLLISLSTSILSKAVWAVGPLIFGYIMLRRKLPWLAIAACAVVFVPLNQAKHEVRAHAEELRDAGFVSRATTFVDAAWDGFAHGQYTVEDSTGGARDRLNYLTTLARVVSWTPDRVPFWGGESYVTALYAPIPRLFWPDKPRKILGGEFGHRYAFLEASNDETSVNFPQLVEAYANFGVPGVLFGMFFFGLIYAGLHSFIDSPTPPAVAIAVGAALIVQTAQIESDFSLVLGGLLYRVPGLWLLVHILCWKPNPRGSTLTSARVA